MKKQFSLIFITIIVLVFNVIAQKQITKHKAEILDLLDEFNVPAVGIGLIKDGELSDIKVFGENRKNVYATNNTIFTIASVTKTITTAVTLRLIESGVWKLDEPLYKYWIDPDIADNIWHKKITTRNVLSHQSGLPNWRKALESKKLEILFEPGTDYRYSGEGFEYLRKAIENKLNKTFQEIADSILFQPLQMINTKYRWKEKLDSLSFAFRHTSEGLEYLNQGGFNTSAAGGALTTIEDYAKFCIYTINHAGLSESLFGEMISTQANIKKDIDQGLGWQIVSNLPNGEYALLHEGGEWGVSTIAVVLPESKCGIVIFTNSDNGDEVYTRIIKNYFNHGKEILNKLSGKSYDPESIEIIQVVPEILLSYTGSYYIESFKMSVDILYEGKVLKLRSPYNTLELYAQSETKFFMKDDDFRVEFVKNDSNKTSGIMVIYQGGEPEFAKKTH